MNALASAPPTPRRLWMSVGALAVAETVSWGVLFYSFGVLLPAMESDLAVGRIWLTGAFSAALLVSGCVAAPAGRWLDRWGAPRVMTIGAFAAVVVVLAWSRVNSWPALAAVWLGIGVTHAFVLYEPAFVAVTGWFPEVRQRSRALLVITLVAGFASTVFLPLTGALLEQLGWRNTVAALAVILAGVTLPVHASLPRIRPADASVPGGAHPGGPVGNAKLAPAPGFRWLVTAFALHGLIAGAMVVHAVPLITEAGRTPVRAATMVGLFGVFQVAGRLISAPWWQRAPGAWTVGGLLAAQGLAMVALVFAQHDAAVWIFVVSFGASNGMLTLARPLAVARWCGPSEFGAASGRVAAWSQVARAIAPLAASALHAWRGNYLGVTLLLAAAGAFGVIAAQRAFRRIGDERFPASVGGIARQQG